jgi:hypothetical protein
MNEEELARALASNDKVAQTLALIDDASGIVNAEGLCALLHKTHFVALKGWWHHRLIRRCNMVPGVSGAYVLPLFDKGVGMFEVELEAGFAPWTLVGPTETSEPESVDLETLIQQIRAKVRLQATLAPRPDRLNKDGIYINSGEKKYNDTWYCSEYKGTTCFLLSGGPDNADMRMCGPNCGAQCIACKWAQDLQTVGHMDITLCHWYFETMFADPRTLGTLFQGKIFDIKICHGALDQVSANRTILMMGLEVLLNTDKGRDTYRVIETVNISVSINDCACTVTVKHKEEFYNIFISCQVRQLDGMQRSTISENGYRGTYTACYIVARAHKRG